ncbi:site-specific DNA recombinase [Bradyrhizobium japonicum]
MVVLKEAVAYARYSSDRQNARSIDDQNLVCEKIAAQNGYKVVKFYEDRAISGAGTLARDGWLSLMRAATDPNRTFDAVIIESLSRMSRDLADSARDFKRLTFRQIELIDLEGKLNTMRVGMNGIMNEEFRKHLGNMLRRAWDGRVKEGLIPGKPPYGHRLIPGKPFHHEPDPETAAIVVRIFTEFANGEPLREIAARLNYENIPSPSGGKWNHQVFTAGGGSGEGMIGNRRYIGELIWNANRAAKNPDTEKSTKLKGRPEDLITVPVPHLRIIDQDLWDRAQELRTDRSRQTGGPRVYKKTVIGHMVADKIICGECGGRMRIVGSKTGESKRVGCVTARHNGTCSNSKSYNLNEIEETVLHGVKHNLDVETLMAFTKGAHEEWSARRKAASGERDSVERAINRATEKIDRISNIMLEIESEELPPLMEKLKTLTLERAGLRSKLELIKNQGNVVELLPATVTKFRADLMTVHDALTNAKLTDAEAAPFKVAFGNVFEAVEVHQTGKRKPVEVTPHMRIAAIMGTSFMPRMQSSKEVLEEQGVTNVLLSRQATLSGQKQITAGVSLATQATLKQLGW